MASTDIQRFLQRIQQQFPNVYTSLLSNDWILCVPSALPDPNWVPTEEFIGTKDSVEKSKLSIHQQRIYFEVTRRQTSIL